MAAAGCNSIFGLDTTRLATPDAGRPSAAGGSAGMSGAGGAPQNDDAAEGRDVATDVHDDAAAAGPADANAPSADPGCGPGYLVCEGAPRTCVAGSWSFESGPEGFSLVGPDLAMNGAGDGLAVSDARAVDGTHALSVPSTFNCDRRQIEVVAYPCGLGTPVNMQGKTLAFEVFLDGPALAAGPHEASVSILTPNGQSADVPLSVGQWIPVSLLLTDASNAYAGGFAFTLFMIPTTPPPASECLEWSGTIFLDDFTVH